MALNPCRPLACRTRACADRRSAPRDCACTAFASASLSSVLRCSPASAACNRTPSDMREWKADDHDRSDEQQKGQGRAAPPPRTAASAAANANPTVTLVEVTWKAQCGPCHGPIGHGDGPQGPMVHAPDLTLAEWQNKTDRPANRADHLDRQKPHAQVRLPSRGAGRTGRSHPRGEGPEVTARRASSGRPVG